MSLWASDDTAEWRRALDQYPGVVEGLGVRRLVELDQWWREELPRRLAERAPPYLEREELVRLTEWKMKRGVFRPRNLMLVRSNSDELVLEASRRAFALVPDARAPVDALVALKGVGPATASAALAALRPDTYPFFDDRVAAQIPDLGPPAFTVPGYLRYAAVLRERAATLGLTPEQAARALWAVGEKPT
jgi:hypothetical protein